MPTYNEKSSYTADGLAYRRTFTDIPFSQEIYKILEEDHPLSPEEKARAADRNFVTFFEARYLMTDREIAKTGARQVLELASGLSPRGIALTADPGFVFVEVDLPDKLALKLEVIDRLVTDGVIPRRPNLHSIASNVLDPNLFDRASSYFRPEPVAVVCEGLLRYLSVEDKIVLGKRIHEMLRRFGGAWITPDYEVRAEEMAIPGMRERYEDIARRTGVDVSANLFESGAAMIRCFENMGFAVERIPLADMMDELVSVKRLDLTRTEIETLLNIRSELVMRPI